MENREFQAGLRRRLLKQTNPLHLVRVPHTWGEGESVRIIPRASID